ncbi:hypothetical protein ACP70R_026670 [Stipagrostis hirtigluma subsp. patula]
MAEIEIKTAPADFRFPTTNQTRHCFTRYIEYHRCLNAKGDSTGDCAKFAQYYRSLCPGEWAVCEVMDVLAHANSGMGIRAREFTSQGAYDVDKWNEQRENGTFPGPL